MSKLKDATQLHQFDLKMVELLGIKYYFKLAYKYYIQIIQPPKGS